MDVQCNYGKSLQLTERSEMRMWGVQVCCFLANKESVASSWLPCGKCRIWNGPSGTGCPRVQNSRLIAAPFTKAEILAIEDSVLEQ